MTSADADELDPDDATVERDEAVVNELDVERDLADADEIPDVLGEGDVTPFDETRLAYSGVVEGDDDVDVAELEAAGALLDDPEQVDVDDESEPDAEPDDA